MYEKYYHSIAKDIEKVLGRMSDLHVNNTEVKKANGPDLHYLFVYSIEFKHVHKNIRGVIHLGFNDEQYAGSVAMSIANKSGSPKTLEYRDDYLCEFMNTVVGNALNQWDKIGFSAIFSAPKVNKDHVVILQKPGYESSTIVTTLNMSRLFFEVVFIDQAYEALYGKKILVVDDSLMMRQLLIKQLTGIGFNVEMACDGMDAIDKFKDFKPDLTIMDQIMPLLSGLDAIMEIQQFSPDAKFIMLSSSGRQDEVNTARTLNVKTYLIKPLNLSVLNKEIQRVLIN